MWCEKPCYPLAAGGGAHDEGVGGVVSHTAIIGCLISTFKFQQFQLGDVDPGHSYQLFRGFVKGLAFLVKLSGEFVGTHAVD